MKYNILALYVCLLIVTPMFTLTAMADSEPKLKVGVFGGSILTGPKQAGGIIYNEGDESAYEITYIFKITGGFDNSINITITDQEDELSPNECLTLVIMGVRGFGPVTLSLTATSSNAGETTETSRGFQIGPYTISKPYILAFF